LSEIKKLIADATKRNIILKVDDVEDFLQARQILTEHPEHFAAKRVVEEFGKLFNFGEEPKSFAKFCLPQRPLTPEQLAEDKRRAKAFLARTADINPAVVAKCHDAQVFRADKPGLTEGIRGFKTRTGLTDEQILNMPPEQLMAHR